MRSKRAAISVELLRRPMSQDITGKGKEIMNQVTNAVEKAGKEVASQVSNLTNGKVAEMGKEATEEAIQSSVDKALDVLQVAGDQVRAKDINTERVTIKAGVGIPNVAHVEISTDVPSKREESRGQGFDVKLEDAMG